MSSDSSSYKVLAPTGKSNTRHIPLAASIADLSGKTICAMRHTFRADETFAMIEALFRERYQNIRFISNSKMPDSTAASPEQQAELIKILREKGCDVLLAGNGA